MMFALIILFSMLTLSSADDVGLHFFPDDPIRVEPEILIPEPQSVEASTAVEFLVNSFLHRPDDIPPARNVNTLGEVPDSSWFTNRIGRRNLTDEELRLGPNRSEGPDSEGGWSVVSLKDEGVSWGFVAKDAKGETYFMKIDPAGYPQINTSTEVIVTKLFHAFGYNVPENYLVRASPDDFKKDPELELDDEEFNEVVGKVFEQASPLKDGSYQWVASRKLKGKVLGPFKYIGTRADDANDIFPHEDRRELRGLRVFAAWLNHTDAKRQNSLDVFLKEGGDAGESGIIKHYLLDFGSTLGASAQGPKLRARGHEHTIAMGRALKSAISLGFWDYSWTHPKPDGVPHDGHFAVDCFEPEKWKSNIKNPAFERMLPEDAFWAAKILDRFDEETLRSIVETGEFEDQQEEEDLVEILLGRRQKIFELYFALLNPLADFTVEQGSLRFENLGEKRGLGTVDRYRFEWFSFDNTEGSLTFLQQGETVDRKVELPTSANSSYSIVRLRSQSREHPAWEYPVEVYLRDNSEVVGIRRMTIRE